MSGERGQAGPNGSVECNKRRPRSCPPRDVDLVSTPEHLRPGFRGRARRYNPSDFGLTGNEEWRHPRMFRDMTYETDAGAMETFRQAQPRRQAYETGINLSNLPEECLADMSAPGFDLSLPSQMSDLRGELLADVSAPDMCDVSESHVDDVYGEILDRFRSIRERINRSNQRRQSDDCAMQQHKTQRRIYTHRDPSGHITSQVDEITISNTPSMDCTPAGEGGEPGRHLNFSLLDRSENLMDESMPSYHEPSMPNECFEVMLENETMPSFANSSVLSRRQPTMPSECLEDVSQPTFERSRSRRQSSRRQLTMPSQNLWDILAPSFGDTTRDRTTNECLEDISMPSFEGVSNVSRSRSPRRRQRSRSARNISDTSAPTLVSSRREQTTNECLDDMTMPSFGRSLSASPYRSRRQAHRSMSKPNINDISEPTYVSISRGPMTSECLDDITMPTFGALSNVSRGRMSRGQTMPSECLEDMTMPSFGGISKVSRGRMSRGQTMPSECLEDMTMPSFGGISRGKSPDRHQRSMPSRMTSECLDDMTMPSFGGVAGSSRRQPTLPSECLNDVSAPSFARSSSRGSSRRQRTNIDDISAPSFAHSTKYGDTTGCLEDTSKINRSRRQQLTMPSQNIVDISAPSFASSGRGNTTNECLEDISMPSFAEVSTKSRSRIPKRQQRSAKSSSPCDAPSTRHRSMTNECLDDMTMPSLCGVSAASRRQMTLTSECLDDVSAPSFGRSVSRGSSRRRGTLSSPNPCASSTRCQPANECLEDITMPSFGGVSVASAHRQLTMPSERLEDMSAPSFAGVSGPSRRQTTGLPSECLDDMSMPTFGNISGITRRSECEPALGRSRSVGRSVRRKHNLSKSHSSSECLENVTMPSFGGNSYSSRRKSTTLSQKSMPPFTDLSAMRTNECLEDVTMPSIGDVSGRSRASSPRQRIITPRRGQLTSECLDDQTMPSFGGVSQSSGRSTARRHTQNIPSSSPEFNTNECLENISMPSYLNNTRASRVNTITSMQRSRQGAMTNECLDEVTMPSLGTSSRVTATNECLEDISMPSYRDHTGSLRRRCPTPIQSSRQECLDDMTMPSLASTMQTYGETTRSPRGKSPGPMQSVRQRTLTNECLDDVTMPSLGRSYGGPLTNECLEDISMPPCGESTGSSRGRSPMQRSRQGAMISERLDDMTMPSFGSSARGHATSECLEDISMPSYGTNSGMSRRRPLTPSQRSNQNATTECLDDMTMPSFGDPSHGTGLSECPEAFRSLSSRSPKQIQKFQGPMTNEDLDNITMPSFGTFGQSRATNECLEDVSMPSYIRNTNSIPGRSTTPRQRTRNEMTTNECLDDMTMPSYGEVFATPRRQMTLPSECLNDVSQPSFARSTSEGTSRRHGNLTPQSTASRGRSPRPNQRSVTNECLDDMTMPTLGDISGSSRRGMHTSLRLEDISMPSGVLNRTQHSGECDEDKVGGTQGGPWTNECLEDVSAPSFAPSSRMTSRHMPEMTNECLEDVSMPLNESLDMNDSKSIARRPPDISYPSELLANESAPSYHSRQDKSDKSADCPASSTQKTGRSRAWESSSGDRLEDVTMPTFEDVSYQPRRHQLTMPSENLEDQTQPEFFSSTALPSSTRTEKRHVKKSPRQEQKSSSKQLADESAPAILKDTTKGPSELVKEVTVQSSTTSVTRVFQKTAETSNNSGHPMIEDLSLPQFESTGASNHQDSSLHGFQSMDNYRPFDELIYSQNSVGNQTQPETPQSARSTNRSRIGRRTPRTPRSPSTPSTPSNRGATSPCSSTGTPEQPCDMISTNYPYGKPHCYSRKPC